MKDSSDFLFAKPSFLSGMASALDMGGTLTNYNNSKDSKRADYNALKADIGVVNKDMKTAAKQFLKDNKKK